MKFKIKHEVEQEIEIDFPIYLEFGGVVKIISPNSYITARVSDGEWRIEKLKHAPFSVGNIILQGKSISKEQFDKGYETAMSHIVREAFMQCSQVSPATEQDKLEAREEINERTSAEVENEVYAFEE